MQRSRRCKCAACRINNLPRSAEHGQGGVALELVHPPAVLVDHSDDDAEELVQQSHDLLRGALDGKLGRADDVDEQHGHLPGLAAQFEIALHCLAGDVHADVPTEHVPHAFALAQPCRHRIEAGLQHA